MGERCLIIGATGQLGRALCAQLRDHHEVIESAYRDTRNGQLRIDLRDPGASVAAVMAARARWIIIAAAFCNVDRCEQEPDTCLRVNVEGPRAIAEYARDHEAVVVYYSTDHVFDGAQPVYREADPVSPLNVYARSKAQAEAMLQQLLPSQHLILRTASLFGPDAARKNFVLRVVDLVSAGQPVHVAADQWGSPTYTEDLAGATRALLERGARGLVHATGPEFMDRAALAREVCAVFGLDAGRIVALATSQLDQAARRPLRVRLDCQKLRELGIGPFRTVRLGLEALREEERANASRR